MGNRKSTPAKNAQYDNDLASLSVGGDELLG
jgi:hypothetical protein